MIVGGFGSMLGKLIDGEIERPVVMLRSLEGEDWGAGGEILTV